MEKWGNAVFGIILLLGIAGVVFYKQQEARQTEAKAVTEKGMIQRMKQLELDVRSLEDKLESIGELLAPDSASA
jgi:hypothetical protein